MHFVFLAFFSVPTPIILFLKVPQENSGLTTAVLQLWAEDISTLHKVRDDMKAVSVGHREEMQ